jgi:hypothetical protein
MMIDIRWRLQDAVDLAIAIAVQEEYTEIQDLINKANVSGDYQPLVDKVEGLITLLGIIADGASQIDQVTLTQSARKFIQSLYNHCPGLRQALINDASIDPDCLP